MKIYVVGDIHGMLFKLDKLMDRIPLTVGKDRLIFLGDYIDRGPDACGVVERILEYMDLGVDVVCLRGNHEVMLFDYLEGRERDLFLINGGRSTLRSYRMDLGEEGRIPERHLEFFRNLKRFYETDDYYFVHAGFRPGIPVQAQSDEDLYWIRGEFIYSDEDFGKKVVFGHTPFHEPYVDAHKIGIDTGAVYGNKLTCVCLPDERFYSV